MFLQSLNEQQREAFLVLASKIAMSDGEDSSEELAAIDSLKTEMGITHNVDIQKVLAGLDVSAFDTHRSRVVAALELLRLTYADEYVHEAEVAEVRDVCTAMGFPEEWLSTMGEWASRFNEIDGEDLEGEMAEYRDALIKHAEQMMEV